MSAGAVREVVVVGGGQAGLAMGHHLARRGFDFTILEAGDGPAEGWLGRWDSLRLFTPARRDALPGRPFPGDPDRYPTRDEVVAYLTGYAAELPVEYGSRVRALRRDGEGFRLDLDDRIVEARQVVVATGPFQVPRMPAVASALAPEVRALHSSFYRRPADLPEGPVLVVGGGNTGFQIAEELAATREVHLAIGSRQTPMPQRMLGRDLFDWLVALGVMRVTTGSRIGRRMSEREALVGSSPRGARRLGIELHPRAISASGAAVAFEDGGQIEPAAVIWATGFELDHGWIDAPVFDERGAVVQDRGVTSVPGLSFLGLPWMRTRGSALLGWVGDDAEHLADVVAAWAAAAG